MLGRVVVVALLCGLGGSAAGYAVFWGRSRFDVFSHLPLLQTLRIYLGYSRTAVLMGGVIGVLVGIVLAAAAEGGLW